MSKDDFLGEIISNYDDHIRNVIYKLQKYSDVLLKDLSDISSAENNFNFNYSNIPQKKLGNNNNYNINISNNKYISEKNIKKINIS